MIVCPQGPKWDFLGGAVPKKIEFCTLLSFHELNQQERIIFEDLNMSDFERYWYALYTRPKCEKQVAEALSELEIETFLPLKKVTKIWSDRKKKLMQPLFPSYLFVYANLGERLASLRPRGAVNIVSFGGIPSRIPNDQIDAVRRVLQHGYVPEDCPYIENGDKVQVIDGPLRGLTGHVVEKRGEKHLIISLDTLYKSISINIHSGYLKRIYPEIKESTQIAFSQ